MIAKELSETRYDVIWGSFHDLQFYTRFHSTVDVFQKDASVAEMITDSSGEKDGELKVVSRIHFAHSDDLVHSKHDQKLKDWRKLGKKGIDKKPKMKLRP